MRVRVRVRVRVWVRVRVRVSREQAEQAAVEVHHGVAGEEAHRQQRRDGVERADQHAHGADQVRCGEGELRLAAGEAGERAHRAEHAVGGDGREEAGRDDDALQRLSEGRAVGCCV